MVWRGRGGGGWGDERQGDGGVGRWRGGAWRGRGGGGAAGRGVGEGRAAVEAGRGWAMEGGAARGRGHAVAREGPGRAPRSRLRFPAGLVPAAAWASESRSSRCSSDHQVHLPRRATVTVHVKITRKLLSQPDLDIITRACSSHLLCFPNKRLC